MKRFLLLSIIALFSLKGFAQENKLPINQFQTEFSKAYASYPDVPKGLLEAVSFTMTRLQHIKSVEESCVGMPKVYGVMGLTLDGKNYFKNNLNYVASVSGIKTVDIINNPESNILAFAAAYSYQLSILSPFQNQEENVAQIISQLSELPSNKTEQDFALNSHLYSVLSFMNNKEMQIAYNFPNPNFNLEIVFGQENLKVLQAGYVNATNGNVSGGGVNYKKSTINNKTADYGPALWAAADNSNWSSRNGTPVSEVTIHTVQGSYAGCISWFQNPSANVSAHYVVRSSDGQITQMVLEKDKGWHVGNSNPSAIGLEHEGYVNNPAWYTTAMYQASADLVRDITQSGYGINPLRTAYFPWTATTNYNVSSIPGSCIKIKGHQHFPSQTHTDPGANWDWDYFYKLINDPFTTANSSTAQSGTITDMGGAGNYTNDEHTYFLIQPAGAQSIMLMVNQFDIESTWDYLYIYDGTTVFDPLVGRYDGTTIPPTINVNGGNVLVEFRSDCGTVAAGYDISWNASITTGVYEESLDLMNVYPNPSQGMVNVSFGQTQTGVLLLTNLLGESIRQVSFENEYSKRINLEGLSKGVYLMNWNNQITKLVIQ
jgi:N-acetyl-anhydromuramyl-L-alanine amidase AmpD